MATGASSCPHCGLPSVKEVEPFCCVGCKAAYTLLEDNGLLKFYDLKDEERGPVAVSHEGSFTWLEAAWDEALQRKSGDRVRLKVRLKGMHCAACGWLIENLFRRHAGAVSIEVNGSRGIADLLVHESFDPMPFFAALRELGYDATTFDDVTADKETSPWVRFGVVFALAMNVMILSFAFYFGLSEDTAPASVVTAFGWVSMALTGLALLVGGPVFMKSGFGALRRGVLHLDLPISLGLILAFAGSVFTFVTRGHEAAYFDSVIVFLTLMLFGRALQERTLERNRATLDDDQSAEELRFRTLADDGKVVFTRAKDLRPDDHVLLASQDLNVCASTLHGHAARLFSLEWLTGESEPVSFAPGDDVPAGAVLVDDGAAELIVTAPYQKSFLTELLAPRSLREDPLKKKRDARILTWWTAGVLVTAAVAGVAWTMTAGFNAGLDVVVAILVVSCPCALGLAHPLAQEAALSVLRNSGVWVREASFLERMANIRKVFFDKTGTLTAGQLDVDNVQDLALLDGHQRDMLHHLVSRSNHPRSRAVLAVIGPVERAFDAAVVEEPGLGLSADLDGRHVFFGKGTDGASVLRVDDVDVVSLVFSERLREDLSVTLQDLQRRGIDVEVLSGDHQDRVTAFAHSIGLDVNLAKGDLTPADKAAHIAAVDAHDTLMLGDGLNDTLAFSAATCAGAPSGIHACLPVHTDFVLPQGGLRPLVDAYDIAHRKQKVVRGNYIFAGVYNLVAIGLAAAGVMSPLLCAILMPISSLIVVLSTVAFTRLPARDDTSSTWALDAKPMQAEEVPA